MYQNEEEACMPEFHIKAKVVVKSQSCEDIDSHGNKFNFQTETVFLLPEKSDTQTIMFFDQEIEKLEFAKNGFNEFIAIFKDGINKPARIAFSAASKDIPDYHFWLMTVDVEEKVLKYFKDKYIHFSIQPSHMEDMFSV